MDPADVTAYLHEQIPLSQAMGVRVVQCGEAGVTLAAPLEPNLNHRQTAFGGSISALAILAGWTAVYVRLLEIPFPVRLVIQRNNVEYREAITGEFEATCPAPSPEQWQRFRALLERKGMARLTLSATVTCRDLLAATFTGDYVGLRIAE